MSSEPSATQVRDRAIRDGINELLGQCTDKQKSFLHNIHDHAPWNGLHNCPSSKLDDTYELLRRTVNSNNQREGAHG